MKKIFCLTIALLIFLCACGGSNYSIKETNLETFSYKEDYDYFKDQPGVKYTGFVNVKKTEVKDYRDAINLAKKECTVEYDSLNYAYDQEAKVYRVCFYTMDIIGGNQDVYINQDGITQFIAWGE